MRAAILKETSSFMSNEFYTNTKLRFHITFIDETNMRVKSRLYSSPILLSLHHKS